MPAIQLKDIYKSYLWLRLGKQLNQAGFSKDRDCILLVNATKEVPVLQISETRGLELSAYLSIDLKC